MYILSQYSRLQWAIVFNIYSTIFLSHILKYTLNTHVFFRALENTEYRLYFEMSFTIFCEFVQIHVRYTVNTYGIHLVLLYCTQYNPNIL